MGLSGRPQGGAKVLLRHGSKLRPGIVIQITATTDIEGRFAFPGLPADAAEVRLFAYAPGKDLATASEGIPASPLPGAARALVVLEPRKVMRIRFRVPEGLPPVEGVAALERDGQWIPFAESEALLSVEAGGAAATAPAPIGIKYHSELYGGGAFFAVPAALKEKDTVLDLARPDWVEGKVLDDRNLPAAGVLYRAENSFRGLVSVTGADGLFRIRRLRAGAVQVQFRAPLYRDTVLLLTRDQGKRALELRLDRGSAPIAIRLPPAAVGPRAASGDGEVSRPFCLAEARAMELRRAASSATPAASARMRWAGGDIRRAIPGPDGVFHLAGLRPAAYRIRLDCPGAAPAEDTALPGALVTFPTPRPAIPVRGRVLGRPSGAPLPAFRFAAAGLRPESPEAGLHDAADIADSLGRFEVDRGFRGATWICASAEGYSPACRAVAEGDTLDADLHLDPGFSLAVKAAAAGPDGDTLALSGARVRLRRAGSRGAGLVGETDAEGVFRANGLGRGEYLVDVREGGRKAWKAAVDPARDTALEARLAPGHALEGRLLAWDGRPPRGLRVLARPDWPSGTDCPGAIAESPVKPDGSFALLGLGGCPATLGVAATWSRGAPFLPLWRLDAQRPGGAPLELRLPRTRPWEITALSGGRPLPVDAEVHVLVPPLSDSLPGEPLGHPVGRAAFRGTYTVNAYEGVRYVAVLGARGYRERADTVTIPVGEDAFETRLELAAWPEARGRLILAADAPPPVGWTARGPAGEAVPIEPDGAFRLPGLPPGPVPVEIRDAEDRPARQGTLLSGGAESAVPMLGEFREWSGLAVDAAGLPVPGAQVLLRRREFPAEAARAVADGAGHFTFRAPPGAWLACPEDPALPCTRLPRDPTPVPPVAASAPATTPPAAAASPALPPVSAPVPASRPPFRVRVAQENTKVTVTLKVPMTLPMRGAAVLVGPWGFASPAESRDGDLLHARMAFPAPPGPAALVAAAYAPSPALQYWAAEPAESSRLAPAPPGPGIQVNASGPDGRPVRGVSVRFLPRSSSLGRSWGEAEGWRAPSLLLSGTDASGGLHCVGVHPGRYWIYASHASLASAPVAWDQARASASAVSLAMKPGAPIRVKVAYEGHPVAGARVEVYDSLGNRAAPAAWAQRDGDLIECGAFPPGRYQVAAAAPGLGRLVKEVVVGGAEGGGANLEASLPAAGWLEVTGEGLGDRGFYLKDRNDQVTPLVRQAEAPPLSPEGKPGGSLLFHGIPPERYQVWMEGGSEGLGEVEIRPAGLTTLEVGRPVRVRMALPLRKG